MLSGTKQKYINIHTRCLDEDTVDAMAIELTTQHSSATVAPLWWFVAATVVVHVQESHTLAKIGALIDFQNNQNERALDIFRQQTRFDSKCIPRDHTNRFAIVYTQSSRGDACAVLQNSHVHLFLMFVGNPHTWQNRRPRSFSIQTKWTCSQCSSTTKASHWPSSDFVGR